MFAAAEDKELAVSTLTLTADTAKHSELTL